MILTLHTCPVCKKRHGRPFACDGLVIENNQVLLIKRDHGPDKGYWAIPGGYINDDETAEECCIREVKEETGLQVVIQFFLGLYTNPNREPRRTVTAVYIVNSNAGKISAGDDATDICWFDLHKLPKELAFDHRKIISDYKKSIHYAKKT